MSALSLSEPIPETSYVERNRSPLPSQGKTKATLEKVSYRIGDAFQSIAIVFLEISTSTCALVGLTASAIVASPLFLVAGIFHWTGNRTLKEARITLSTLPKEKVEEKENDAKDDHDLSLDFTNLNRLIKTERVIDCLVITIDEKVDLNANANLTHLKNSLNLIERNVKSVRLAHMALDDIQLQEEDEPLSRRWIIAENDYGVVLTRKKRFRSLTVIIDPPKNNEESVDSATHSRLMEAGKYVEFEKIHWTVFGAAGLDEVTSLNKITYVKNSEIAWHHTGGLPPKHMRVLQNQMKKEQKSLQKTIDKILKKNPPPE